ncbi:hypothetical protein ACTV1I_004472 [Cronobacter dublinensis]
MKRLKSPLAGGLHGVVIKKAHQHRPYYDFLLRSCSASFIAHASITHCEKLAAGFSAFSRSTLASICSIISCGNLIPFLSDFLLVLPVAIAKPSICVCRCWHTIQQVNTGKVLAFLWVVKYSVRTPCEFNRRKKSEARKCYQHKRASHHNLLSRLTAMANVDSTTSARPETGAAGADIFPQAWCGVPMDELLCEPLHFKAGFLALAPACSRLVAELLETHSTAARLALAGRLTLALSLLRDDLPHPLTDAEREALTADQPPAAVTENFMPEPDILCDYCRMLTEVLLSRTLTAPGEKVVAGLLFELVNYLADTLTAPRFYRSPAAGRCAYDGSAAGAGNE